MVRAGALREVAASLPASAFEAASDGVSGRAASACVRAVAVLEGKACASSVRRIALLTRFEGSGADAANAVCAVPSDGLSRAAPPRPPVISRASGGRVTPALIFAALARPPLVTAVVGRQAPAVGVVGGVAGVGRARRYVVAPAAASVLASTLLGLKLVTHVTRPQRTCQLPCLYPTNLRFVVGRKTNRQNRQAIRSYKGLYGLTGVSQVYRRLSDVRPNCSRPTKAITFRQTFSRKSAGNYNVRYISEPPK